MEALRTSLAYVCLEHAFILFRVHDPRRIQRDGALSMGDDRGRAARRERRVGNCGLASEVRHSPRNLTRKLVGPREGLHVCQPA